MAKSYEMNLCEGALFKKLVLYALPLMATNVLQVLFNAADVAILGAFVENSDPAVAAVGATGALINLIVGLFVGLSVGANVLVSRCVGANDLERSRKIVGMSIVFSVVIGTALLFVGFLGARTFLEWMDCDPNVIDMATTYLKIYFLGMPIMMLYNFAASILRAVGDTRRPLVYLVIAGIVNVGLNIFFVTAFQMDVEGVAIATVVSQGISAVLAIIALLKGDGFSKLEVKKMRFYPRELWEMVKVGVPAGLQGCAFSFSNVLIQSSINSFGDLTMTANTIASQFEGFVYNAMNGVSLATLSFVSQNLGAGKTDRVRKSVLYSALFCTIVWAAVCGPILLLSRPLCGLLSKNGEVIRLACKRLWIIGSTYLLCGWMDIFGNALRGLGKSTVAMIICLSGSCLFRILWINTVFKEFSVVDTVWWVYPVSWALTIGIYLIVYFPLMRSVEKRCARENAEAENIAAETSVETAVEITDETASAETSVAEKTGLKTVNEEGMA